MRRVLAIGSVVLAICLLAMGNALAEPSGKLIIFHAGSLSGPFAKIEKNFEKMYPKVDVVRESGGSTNLIPNFASWNIRFASNQMVLCYTEKSRFAGEISSDNWADILLKKGVVWGHSDPNLDPCGYRSLMVLQLAEKFYGKPGLYKALLANRPSKNVRPKASELISLLQSGDMDYAWEYLSVAVQHGLKYITLDKHLNLGDYSMTPYYKSAKVRVTGKKPGTFIDRVGKSITYGITRIDKAPNSEAADAFLAYLFAPDGGLMILKDMGQPPFVPVRTNAEGMEKLPTSIKSLVTVAN